jgi:NADH dehydrogenase
VTSRPIRDVLRRHRNTFKNRVLVLVNWTIAFLGRCRAERVITEQQVFGRQAREAQAAAIQSAHPGVTTAEATGPVLRPGIASDVRPNPAPISYYSRRSLSCRRGWGGRLAAASRWMRSHDPRKCLLSIRLARVWWPI